MIMPLMDIRHSRPQRKTLHQCQALDFFLNPLTIHSMPFRTDSPEERSCFVLSTNINKPFCGEHKKFRVHTDCQKKTEHMCPLLAAWPNMHTARRPKQPPLVLANVTSTLEKHPT